MRRFWRRFLYFWVVAAIVELGMSWLDPRHPTPWGVAIALAEICLCMAMMQDRAVNKRQYNTWIALAFVGIAISFVGLIARIANRI